MEWIHEAVNYINHRHEVLWVHDVQVVKRIALSCLSDPEPIVMSSDSESSTQIILFYVRIVKNTFVILARFYSVPQKNKVRYT